MSQRYIDVHAEHQRFGGELRRARRRCCAVRTLVVLREPFAQLVSEMDFFPRDFSPELARPGAGPWWRTPWFEIREDHLVCEHGALMGLCECASVQRRQCRRERCNATSVLQRLRTEFDHIGIVGATMGCTYSILARWMAEGGGLSDPDDAEVVRMLEWRARWSERRARNTSARLSRFYEIQSDMPSPFPPPPPGRDAMARPENRRQRRPLRRQGTPQHLALLQHLPSRAEFDAHNVRRSQPTRPLAARHA